MSFAAIAVIALMLATAGALVMGIATMARGKAGHEPASNKMMVWRVGLQGATLLLLAILFLAK